MRYTVFGGSKPQPGEAAYDEAKTLGKLLGAGGHTVLTGGYIGSMEAVSRGASGAGGHVIGVTCDEIESWRPGRPNRWIHEEIRLPTIHQRILVLIENCDAALALPGGTGTLAEISTLWTLLITAAIPPRPFILIGPAWHKVMQQLYASLGEYIPEVQRGWISFAPDAMTAYTQLQKHEANGEK